MSAQLQDSVLGRLNDLLSELGRTKAAAAGDAMGGTTHPSEKVDNGTQKAREGERARENSADAKKMFPTPIVDNVDPHSGGSQDSHQLNIGVRSSATGEDPAVEDDFKGYKDDPGTSHPANVEELGDKYGSASTDALFKHAYAQMDDMLASIVAAAQQLPTPSQPKTAAASPAQQNPSARTIEADAVQQAAQAGYKIAADAGVAEQLEQEKLAWTQQLIYQAWQEGQAAGEKVAQYILACDRVKQAADPAMSAGMPPELMSGAAPASDGGAPGANPGNPGMPGPADGDADDSHLGASLPPGGGHEGGAPGGGGDHEAINELANALIEAGIPPEQLLAAVEHAAGSQGGEAAGLPAPAMGGEKAGSSRTKISPEDRPLLVKLARDVIRHRDAGRTRLKEARNGTQARQARDEVISYVREICGR